MILGAIAPKGQTQVSVTVTYVIGIVSSGLKKYALFETTQSSSQWQQVVNNSTGFCTIISWSISCTQTQQDTDQHPERQLLVESRGFQPRHRGQSTRQPDGAYGQWAAEMERRERVPVVPKPHRGGKPESK